MTVSRSPFFDAGFLAFAHRGGAFWEPNLGRENTLVAFRNAVEAGFRYLETDVHATRDGVLLAFHDDTLDRVTDRRGRIAELPYAEVRRARVGGLEPIPTLTELLDAFPETRFNIDIKQAPAIEPLVGVINAHRAQGRVCVASFGARRLREFRRRMGTQVATCVSVGGVATTALVPGLRRLWRFPGQAFQLPTHTTVRGRRVELVTPGFIRAAHAHGQQVHVWTIDDAAEIRRLVALGVDGIMSDRPDVLKQTLVELGRWD